MGHGVPASFLQATWSCVSCAWTLPSGHLSRKSCVTWQASRRAGGRSVRLPYARLGEWGRRLCTGQQPVSPVEEGVLPLGMVSLQVGDPSLGAMPSDLRRGTGAVGCALCEVGPWTLHLFTSLQVLASAPARTPRGLQSGALPRQVGPSQGGRWSWGVSRGCM